MIFRGFCLVVIVTVVIEGDSMPVPATIFLQSHKHSPTTIFFSTFNVLLQNQLVEQFLNGSNTDACHFFHICQRKRWPCTHRIKDYRIVRMEKSLDF